MRPRIYIDGQHGTTGLELDALLGARDDIELLAIPHADRHDVAARLACMRAADVVVLCLPDDAAREALALIAGHDIDTRVLDASSAHRVHPQWVYGLPELAPGQREAIAGAARVSNPGCYPTGYLLSVRPLVDAGIVPADLRLQCHALSGYSGGGRGLIQRFDADPRPHSWAARPYGLDLAHKHVPEMRHQAGSVHAPLFMPVVCDYLRGMITQVGLFTAELAGGADAAAVLEALRARYADEPAVQVRAGADAIAQDPYLSPEVMNHTNSVELLVFNDAAGEQVVVMARLDNLGKGAAGAAVQNLNLMLGRDEFTGLELAA